MLFFDYIIQAWNKDIDASFSGILLDENYIKKKARAFYFIFIIIFLYFVQNFNLSIRYDKIDGFIKIQNRIRYSILFSVIVVGLIEFVMGLNILNVEKWYYG